MSERDDDLRLDVPPGDTGDSEEQVSKTIKRQRVNTAISEFVSSREGRAFNCYTRHAIDINDRETAEIVIDIITKGVEIDDIHTLARKIAFIHDFSNELSGDGFNAPQNWRRSELHRKMWIALANRLIREKDSVHAVDFIFIWNHVVSRRDIREATGEVEIIERIASEDREKFISRVLDYLKTAIR